MSLATRGANVEVITMLIILLILAVYLFLKRKFNYWKDKGVPFIEPNLILGNTENPVTRKYYVGEWFQRVYNHFKSQGNKHGGYYALFNPVYIPILPEMIKCVLQKDFQHFVDRGFYYNEKDDPLSAHLFAIGGQKWRNLRTKLTPTFTSGKMKMMFNILVQCGQQMSDSVENHCLKKESVDIKNTLACFTTDVIGSCAFGLDCDSFKSPDAEFRKYGKKVFDPVSKLRAIKNMLSFTLPKFANTIGLKMFESETTDFFKKVIKDTVEYRKVNKVRRNDMLQLLIDMQDSEESGENGTSSLTLEEIAAQAFIFFVAGFETSSTTMTFCLYELATNLDIQERMRQEIIKVFLKYQGELTYEAIMEMKYMDQVIEETLRKYPPVSFITRVCTKDYQIPNTSVTIEKNTKVLISLLGLHNDPDYYPDPNRFDPERFSNVNKSKLVPFSYIPFGEGPRICIGQRFGLMQTKVGLTMLLKDYAFSLNNKTKTPLAWDRYSHILPSESAIWLNAEKITI